MLLLDGEQTVIGGLYSTDENVQRQGIPVLKDLPWWFFGLRYVFGFERVSKIQKELVIVLQAELLDDLRDRVERPLGQDVLEQQRERFRRSIRRVDEEKARELPMPSEDY